MMPHPSTPSVRPLLQTRRSPTGQTLYLSMPTRSHREIAYVFCQLKQKACVRDSVAHKAHTVVFAVKKAVYRAAHLKPPAGSMTFPTVRQGRDVRSPLAELPPAID